MLRLIVGLVALLGGFILVGMLVAPPERQSAGWVS